MNKKILLIITGSVAAYKSLDLVRLLIKNNYQITPVMTKAAQEFITPLLVSSICGNDVYCDLFSLDEENKMGHINLSRDNDLILVAPASADFISKINNAIADDLASTAILAANKPIMIAPAMNEKMWLNKSNQDNILQLKSKSIKILEPKEDLLACGEYGLGKMMEIDDIFKKIEDFFNIKQSLFGKNILITAGATFEPIDPVRFIGNYSSGKQGLAIANKISDLGGNVKLIAANINENINLNNDNVIRVKTASEMNNAVMENISNIDVFISVAAVADFKPKQYNDKKIKKDSNFNKIDLVENVDILSQVGSLKNKPKITIGFAAESEDLIKNAQIKLQKKNCDFIIANNIDDGKVFGSQYNKITILDKNGDCKEYCKMQKSDVADIIVQKLQQILDLYDS
ncbi:bifunctional phosphopantothenoylcysteine decarboxylase/phosphopantothenate--cysteine ligase CoaBC [Rickettsiales bacterium]|nr:bifunctional phosphopantothenoylcysteine decarboxylase/phosphopantothenate--cysteine ligase CoaBC [Rickettsiales bacterium]